MNRRRYLASLATIGLSGVAGCTSEGSSDPAETTTEGPSTDTSTTTRQTTTTAESSTTTTVADLPSDEELKENAEQIPYEDFFRNFEEHRGNKQPVHYPYGGIYQVLYDYYDEGVDHIQLQVSTTEDEWQGDIAALWSKDTRLLEDDLIELWGLPADLYQYETVKGDSRTIPRIIMFDARVRDSTDNDS